MNKLVKSMLWKYGTKVLVVKFINGSFKWILLSLAIDTAKYIILNT